MLRPSGGNDFVYSEQEIDIILEDIKIMKINGADGFVFGALTPEGDVDLINCKKVLEACQPLPVTFHRAFDVCRLPFEALEAIIKLGFVRLLTSGMSENANLGSSNIKLLVDQAGGKISIMPGCGITPENVRDILQKTGAKEVHASAKIKKARHVFRKIDVCFGSNDEYVYVTDSKVVRELINAITI